MRKEMMEERRSKEVRWLRIRKRRRQINKRMRNL